MTSGFQWAFPGKVRWSPINGISALWQRTIGWWNPGRQDHQSGTTAPTGGRVLWLHSPRTDCRMTKATKAWPSFANLVQPVGFKRPLEWFLVILARRENIKAAGSRIRRDPQARTSRFWAKRLRAYCSGFPMLPAKTFPWDASCDEFVWYCARDWEKTRLAFLCQLSSWKHDCFPFPHKVLRAQHKLQSYELSLLIALLHWHQHFCDFAVTDLWLCNHRPSLAVLVQAKFLANFKKHDFLNG